MTEQPRDAFTERLADIQGPRRGATRAPMLIGSLLAPLGLLCITLGWLGAARTPVLQEEIAYGISGGLTGLALVVVGCFLYFGHWQTQLIRETRAQTVQLAEELHRVQGSLEALVTGLSTQSARALVATPAGSISHLPGCSVVKQRTDLHAVNGELTPCRICQPA